MPAGSDWSLAKLIPICGWWLVGMFIYRRPQVRCLLIIHLREIDAHYRAARVSSPSHWSPAQYVFSVLYVLSPSWPASGITGVVYYPSSSPQENPPQTCQWHHSHSCRWEPPRLYLGALSSEQPETLQKGSGLPPPQNCSTGRSSVYIHVVVVVHSCQMYWRQQTRILAYCLLPKRVSVFLPIPPCWNMHCSAPPSGDRWC